MNKQEQLALAIEIAVIGHKNQYDISGKAYILHPLHLMHKTLFDVELATIAVLHDIIEDSKVTIEDLKRQNFSSRVITAIKLLTHVVPMNGLVIPRLMALVFTLN